MKKFLVLAAAVGLVVVLAMRAPIRADSVGTQIADSDLAAIRGGGDCAIEWRYTCEGGPSFCNGPGCSPLTRKCMIMVPGLFQHHNYWYDCEFGYPMEFYYCSEEYSFGCNEIVACGPNCTFDEIEMKWKCPNAGTPYDTDIHTESRGIDDSCGAP